MLRMTLRSSCTALYISSLEDWLCAFGMEDASREGWEQVRLSAEAAQQKTDSGQSILMSRLKRYYLASIMYNIWRMLDP